MKDLELIITLWPTFPHFPRFALDTRLAGVRLNTAMIPADALDEDFKIIEALPSHLPLYFDIKGRQLRIRDVGKNTDHLELVLNRPIQVKTPTMVLFKAGEDYALLNEVKDGTHLIFEGGPKFMLHPGESLQIRERSLKVGGPVLLDYEIEKILKAKKAGFDRFFLSYVEDQQDIEEFREYVGNTEIIAKIENQNGLDYVATRFKKEDNLSLMAARGDLYVELAKPHHILEALKVIIQKDPDASIGSRILLSLVNSPVPSCADLSELAWLYDLGYRKMMLCDELCLKEDLLSRAVNVFDSFRASYAS